MPELRAGVASIDITPPPGLSLFGHGPEGRIAVGWRTRLFCHPFVFQQGGEIVALVPCDLAAVSHLLQRTVAARLKEAGVHIPAQRLFLMATHTHAGPAHYFGSASYSGSFSTRAPGFDPEVLDFLANRIAAGVARAYQDREPASVTWRVRCVTTGLTRNRSIEPFVSNPAIAGSLGAAREQLLAPDEAVEEPDPADEESAPTDTPPADVIAGSYCVADWDRARRTQGPLAAVDPTLTALTVRDVDRGAIKGVFAVFGMHPTVVPNANDVYHGDVFGMASRLAAATLAENHDSDVVVGIANGAEGDVSPAWHEQSFDEARRIARLLSNEIVSAVEEEAEEPGVIEPSGTTGGAAAELRTVYRELSLPDECASAECHTRLCRHPQLGAPAAGGAEDGPTVFRIVPVFNEGVRVRGPQPRPDPDDADVQEERCHHPRLPLVSPAGRFSSERPDLPVVAPVGLVRIGGMVLVTMPAEVTTIAAQRMVRSVARALGNASGIEHVALVGLTNAYLQYVTTPEEYVHQHYEGASTLYGPRSAPFFINHLRCLAPRLVAGAEDDAIACPRQRDASRVDELRPVEYFETPSVERMPPQENGSEASTGLLCPERDDHPPLRWTLRWIGTEPGNVRERADLWVRIHRLDESGSRFAVAATDEDPSVEVRLVWDERHQRRLWTAVWYPDFRVEAGPGPDDHLYQFEVGGRVQLDSEPFRGNERRPPSVWCRP